MPRTLTILLIGLLAVVVISAVVAMAAPALWFSITAPIRAVSSKGQPTEVGVPQPTGTTQLTASPAPTLSRAPATSAAPTAVASDDCTPAGTLTADNGRIAYMGISFQLDPRLATTVTVEHCRAVPFSAAALEGPVHPEGLTFTFLTKLRRAYFQPQVAVYAVEGDMQGYPYPANSLGALEALLKERPEPSPWFGDAMLHDRPKYLDFANGAGVRLITQDARDIFFYTNNNVLYNFDGLTSDGRSYVSVRVPVALPFLMDIDGPDPRTNHNPLAIPIPPDWPKYGYDQRPIIDAYNLEALRRFGQATDADFTPDLALLDALARSLEIVAR